MKNKVLSCINCKHHVHVSSHDALRPHAPQGHRHRSDRSTLEVHEIHTSHARSRSIRGASLFHLPLRLLLLLPQGCQRELYSRISQRCLCLTSFVVVFRRGDTSCQRRRCWILLLLFLLLAEAAAASAAEEGRGAAGPKGGILPKRSHQTPRRHGKPLGSRHVS